MGRVVTALALGLVLGAVRADGQTNQGFDQIKISNAPVRIGSSAEFALSVDPGLVGTSLFAFCGTQAGATPVSLRGASITLPFDASFWTAGRWSLSTPDLRGALKVPYHPALIGLTPQALFVAVSGTNTFVSPLLPFGPIIEDAIQ